MKWDDVRKQYYLEIDDVTNNSEITETDMSEEYGDGDKLRRSIRQASYFVYQYMDAQYRGSQHEHHALALRRMIYKNERKQTALLDAVIEYIRADVTTSMGLNRYVNDKPYVPDSVEHILRAGGLIVKGDFNVMWHTLEGDWNAQT